MGFSVEGVVRLADRFVPSELADDERTRRRARLVVFFTVALCLWAPVFCGVMEALQAPLLAQEIAALASVMVTAPLALKRWKSIPLATAVLIGPLYLLIELVSLKTGGPHSPALIWCLPLPLLALMLSGKRWGAFWLAISGLVISFTGAFAGGVSTQILSPRGDQVLDTACHVAVSIFLLSLAWTYESTQRGIDRALDIAHASLGEAHAATEVGNTELRLILDNVHQGLFTVQIDGTVSGERSAAADALFGCPAPGVHVARYVGALDPTAGVWMELGWEALREGILPLELSLEQLPKKASAGARHLALEYRPIVTTSGVARVLVVVSDVTDAFERERGERDQAELSAVVGKLLADRIGFGEFFTEGAALVAALASSASDDPTREARDLHTLKGNAATFGASSVAETCHDLESALRETGEPLTSADRTRLSASWVGLARRLRAFGWRGRGRTVEVEERDIESVCAAASRGVPRETLVELVRAFQFEPAEVRFARFGDQARSLARRLGKGEVSIEVEDGGLRFDPALWSGFWSTFVHAVRNAVDHGVESLAERTARGKPGVGQLRFSAALKAGNLQIELSDDGRGINWEEIAKRARAAGIDASSRAALELALFQDGVTTRDSVTEVSGRGIGLASLREACKRLGGTLAIVSQRGAGTTVSCALPAVGVCGDQGPEAMRASVRDVSYLGNVSPMR